MRSRRWERRADPLTSEVRAYEDRPIPRYIDETAGTAQLYGVRADRRAARMALQVVPRRGEQPAGGGQRHEPQHTSPLRPRAWADEERGRHQAHQEAAWRPHQEAVREERLL